MWTPAGGIKHTREPALLLFTSLPSKTDLTDTSPTSPPAWIFCIISGVMQRRAFSSPAEALSGFLWCVKPNFTEFHVRSAAVALKGSVITGSSVQGVSVYKMVDSLNNVEFPHQVSPSEVIAFTLFKATFLAPGHFGIIYMISRLH